MWQKTKNYYHLLQALTASLIYGFPAKKLKIIGVTGTDGKTTTAHMIYQILAASGKTAGLVSSIAAVTSGKTYDTGFHVTTPSPFALQKLLKQMVKKETEFAVLEVTSHGLDQNRLAFIPFEIGVLTNISPEHLDYHKTLENYLAAKAKLFRNAKTSVLNADDHSFVKFKKEIGGQLLTYGIKNQSDVNLKNFPLKLKIPGDYNYYNALAAVTATRVLNINDATIKKALEDFSNLEGRMEEVKNNLGIKIYIDFAHTPNALEQALATLRKALSVKSEARIIAVFGVAGERDKSKRPLMGAVSARLANITVITAEDPRSENPAVIAEQIFAGCQKQGGILKENVFIEIDRAKAIKLAIKLAKPGDIVAIFGKGHEKSMAYGGKELPWSDKKEVIEALKKKRPKNEIKF